MRDALVFGGSGQVGVPLLTRLRDAGWRVVAVSRDVHAAAPGLDWLRGDLEHVDGLPDSVDAIFSCGPLDHFARWYATTNIDAPRVVAFGSTSAQAKHDSVDAHERDLAMRLRDGEQDVFEAANRRNAAATVLRPTLVYGAGRDRTLTKIARLASRWGRFVLPRNACGLRQPVHVDDLAQAACAACDAPTAHGQAYALPGGETLPYREMVLRVLAALQPPAHLIELPAPLFDAALLGARMLGARMVGSSDGISAAAIARLCSDLVFDPLPAQRDFGYAPRLFRPTAAMFSAD